MAEHISSKIGHKKPKKLTLQRMENIALWYVERYGGSRESLRRVLYRRVERNQRAHDIDAKQAKEWVEDVIIKLTDLSYLDDRAFARSRVQKLVKAGHSYRMIAMKLRAKGIDETILDETINEHCDADTEHRAAWVYARKRGLGPYRTKDRDVYKQKDLASFARRGFSFEIASQILDSEMVSE